MIIYEIYYMSIKSIKRFAVSSDKGDSSDR